MGRFRQARPGAPRSRKVLTYERHTWAQKGIDLYNPPKGIDLYNHAKKCFDLEEARRIPCRHFNGVTPAGCPRIYCTNSNEKGLYPRFKCRADETGVKRRVLFEIVARDLRRGASAAQAAPHAQPLLLLQDEAEESWQDKLHRVLAEARVEHYFERAFSVRYGLGVALFREVLQKGDDIASRFNMKKLDRGRFVQSIAVARAV